MSTDVATSSGQEIQSNPVQAAPRKSGSVLQWIGMPLFLLFIGLATYIYVQGSDLDSIEQRVLNREILTRDLLTHLKLVGASTIIVIMIAIPLGIIITRRSARHAVPFVVGFVNIGQAIPSLGLITIIVIAFDIGTWPVIIGLVAYSALPILRNTMAGLNQVDHNLLKASRGMGLSAFGVLRQVELPLAVPVIIAGIRTALVINVGTATLAFLFGAGGLGYVIFQGIQLNRTPVLVTGVVMASGLALLIDYLGAVAGRLLSPRGL